MTVKTDIRHLFLEELINRTSVGIVACGAWPLYYRLVGNLCSLQGGGQIRMAFKAYIPYGTVEEGFFCRFMGGMTFGAGTQRNRTMHEFLLEWGTVMTTDAELSLVIANVK